ncbi:hypothetical protein G7072_09130 [Nocardioides sp. HDW12B]|uniref:hypothetical protein n=1 Tax=Nocardioides sp. HDW12B TaxID=2714939 RepID=UPI001407515D|nr:hypothetical protein [Nocardioides sp. HDW12B]QIK66492.1 hypothetical protein G7072_09130 [Nocardioides sp. HDW12B]
MTTRRNALASAAALLAAAPLALGLAVPASAHGGSDLDERPALRERASAAPVESDRIEHVSQVPGLPSQPGTAGISGCFMKTAPLFVTSGVESVRVFNVRNPEEPRLVGTLPNAVFENEAMNCGERRTANGVQRFALIGVDLVDAAPTQPEHTNAGGNELIVVDVTRPAAPRIISTAPGTTSTHTVACVDERDCRTAYSAGDSSSGTFSVFDLRDLQKPREVDANANRAGVQPFSSPTSGHKWNFDEAGFGTHTGFDGASMWRTTKPRNPQLVTTTGRAGRGEDPAYPGWNDFILHNSFRPNADAFRAGAAPSIANGNVLLVTEEDYENPDCATAGSFQTWWVKRLDGSPSAIVPLDKVELADLGSFPSPVGAFCSAHWFDFRPGGLVAAGFYGGGTQLLDVRDARDIKPYAHSVWGASEVWDAMWVPVYENGRQTKRRTDVVYAIDLVRGLDVYDVRVPGERAPAGAAGDDSAALPLGQIAPMGLVGGALFASLLVRRRRA